MLFMTIFANIATNSIYSGSLKRIFHMNSITENYREICNAIPAGVRLIAVSKTKPLDQILEVYNTGHRDFGESKVQELNFKHEKLHPDIRWHMIGHLQTNKVKYIAPFVSLIHSVDSLKLLREINKQAAKYNRVIDCLLQMHIAEEETKFGLDDQEAIDLLSSVEFKSMANIRITGLMCMATFTDDTDQIRREFRQLVVYFNLLKERFFSDEPSFCERSMGMSDDYPLAIEEGSTMIRVGSKLFGHR
jgi:PLP dependent protein